MSDPPPIHPKNADGPFYVLDDCCTACGVPTAIAPELFQFDSAGHCYVTRQPASSDETERALRVVRTQELGCVRYRGRDEAVLRRLAEAGEAHQCDYPLPGVGAVPRNIVTFAQTDPRHAPVDTARLLQEFAEYVRAQRPHLKVRTKRITRRGPETSFALAWFENNFHPITIGPGEGAQRWLILHRGNLGLSELLDEWLRSTGRFADLRWYTEDGWQRSRAWQPRPW